MAENKQEVTLRKIPLKLFLEVLTDAYNKGADYVDIIGTPNELQDNIGVAVREEYYTHEDEEEDEEESNGGEKEERNNNETYIETSSSKKLNDEDLNQLI